MMFFKLAEKIGKKASWNKYQYTIDMIQAGYLKCIEKIDKFTLDRPNAFAYFTTIVHNIFIDYIKKENKQKEIKVKLVEDYLEKYGEMLE
jgi:DNA-directed RNA polymerase specialized sigma24 family protein